MTARAEYQRGIMDAVNDPVIEVVAVKKSAQVGWTALIGNVVGYFVDQDPAPLLVMHPTLEMGESWSKNRLAPMIRDTPVLAARIADARSRDSGNTLLEKKFPGGNMAIVGANSPASLASRPIRVVLADEIDRYPASAGAEGDPLSLAFKRTTTFWNRKKLAGSTPTIAGASRIDALWEESDKRLFYVPCPDCEHMQTLTWARVQFDPDEPEKAAYACEECGSLWNDAARWAAVARGEWRATAEFKGVAGFHIWEAYSPWVRLADTVRAFLSAKDDPQQLKTWVNTALGETWREKGEAPDWERLYERREDFKLLPEQVGVLTGFCDVQKDRLEVSVWAWAESLESWLAEHRVIPGDTSRPEVWEELNQFVAGTWPAEGGRKLSLARFGIDSGYATQEVYAWARRQRPGLVMVCKGFDRWDVAVGQPKVADVDVRGKKLRRGIKVWPLGSSLLKSELYGWLRQPVPEDGQEYPRGFVHLPKWVEPEGCQQLVAEQLVTLRNGRREWQKLRDRNEWLDCRVGARAVAISLGVDRWNERQWQAARGETVAPVENKDAAAKPQVAAPPPRERSGWLHGGGRARGGWLGR